MGYKGKFATILWSVWKQRNEKLWNNRYSNPFQTVHFVVQLLAEWKLARRLFTRNDGNVSSQTLVCKKWHKPPALFLKCNTDATSFHESNSFGISCVLMNEFGVFVTCRVQQFPGLPSVRECEALALLHAVSWILEMGVTNVIFEMDATFVVDVIDSTGDDLTEFGSIVHNCKLLLHQVTSFSVQFVFRQANVVAHALAREARFHASPFFFHEIPSFLQMSLNDLCTAVHS